MRGLDPASGLPLYLQVARILRESIAAGELASGDSAPSLRAMASRLRVNVHTVAKSYQLLEREGVLVRRRGDPYRIADGAGAAADLLREDVEALIARAASLNVPGEQVLRMVEQALEERARRRA